MARGVEEPTGPERRGGVAIVSAAALAMASSIGTGAAAPPETQVQTAEGTLGRLASGIPAVRGVPYAEPPVGSSFVRPPQAPRPWTGVAFRPAAGRRVRAAGDLLPGSPASWHEDCLYLNVYARRRGGGKRPVMVWFHGGGWVNGAGTDVQPSWLAAEGNVVVTVNYRLGALGYLASPALDASPATNSRAGNTAISIRSRLCVG